MSVEGATPAFYKSAPTGGAAATGSSSSPSPSSSSSTSGAAQTFQLLEVMLSEELVQKIKGVFQFDLTGEFCDCVWPVMNHQHCFKGTCETVKASYTWAQL